MQNYKIIVAYDGTNYHGWQMQHECISVTQVLQDSFKKAFHKLITIVGASRTDAGVHSAGQVAFFSLDFAIDAEDMRFAWNNVLPPSVVIRSITPVSSAFHPQKNVIQKTYYYHIFLKRPLPFFARYGWFFRRPFSLEELRDCLQVFVGTHDFRSFVTLDDEKKSTIRTIDEISVDYIERYKAVRIAVRGRSFLHYMIRRIVGAALDTASHDHLNRSTLEKALAEKNPQQSLQRAPASGLLLYKIRYEDIG